MCMPKKKRETLKNGGRNISFENPMRNALGASRIQALDTIISESFFVELDESVKEGHISREELPKYLLILPEYNDARVSISRLCKEIAVEQLEKVRARANRPKKDVFEELQSRTFFLHDGIRRAIGRTTDNHPMHKILLIEFDIHLREYLWVFAENLAETKEDRDFIVKAAQAVDTQFIQMGIPSNAASVSRFINAIPRDMSLQNSVRDVVGKSIATKTSLDEIFEEVNALSFFRAIPPTSYKVPGKNLWVDILSPNFGGETGIDTEYRLIQLCSLVIRNTPEPDPGLQSRQVSEGMTLTNLPKESGIYLIFDRGLRDFVVPGTYVRLYDIIKARDKEFSLETYYAFLSDVLIRVWDVLSDQPDEGSGSSPIETHVPSVTSSQDLSVSPVDEVSNPVQPRARTRARFPSIKGSEARARFVRLFGEPVRVSGTSHHVFRNKITGRSCSIPIKLGEDVPKGTLASALRDIGITPSDFFDRS